MNNRLKFPAACGLYGIAALWFFLSFGYPAAGTAGAMLFKLGTAGLGTAALIAGSALLAGSRPEKAAAIRRTTLWVLFILYLSALSVLLFGDAFYGRSRWADGYSPADHGQSAVNLRPFATIRTYLHWLFWDLAPQAVVNLIGNLAAFAPLGLFLPLLFGRLHRFGWYALTAAALILSVEGIQLLTGTGVCDIDDFLLNFAGAAAFFWLCRLPPVKRRLARLG